MERTEGVRSFVGIDAHSGHCSIKVLSAAGENLAEFRVPTAVKELRAAVRGLAAPAWAMLESSFLAGFVKDSIEREVSRVIVCETRENRWIAKSEDKSDPKDADRLARLLRMGEFREVYVPKGMGRDRRELLRMYGKAQGDVARTKNRIKGKYREHGIFPKGSKVFSAEHRGEWLEKLDRPAIRLLVEALYEKLERDVGFRDRVLAQLVELMKGTNEYELLKTIPGVGKVLAGVMSAVIGDAARFAGKRQLWSYAGLGLCSRSSGDLGQSRVRGSSGGNRSLKHAALSAATSSIRGANRFSRHYEKMVGEGIDPAMAKRTVARQILAAALAMLKRGQVYREEA
jgi:transposase